MARRRKAKDITHWGWRLGGVVLCTFFVLGMVAGTSLPGRALVGRVDRSLSGVRRTAAMIAAPLISLWAGKTAAVSSPPRAYGAVAIVERWDGFYALSARGGLRGPISPEAQGNLPILSGPGIKDASVQDLLADASTLVRAEAVLSKLISEMRVEDDGTAILFLDRSHTQLSIDLASATRQFRHAAEVLDRWRGHQQLIAALDLTTPGQAVVRLRGMRALASAPARVRRVEARRRDLAAGAGVTSR